MSLISISGPSDGQTIDAADVNTPLNTIANEINGNLDNANIKTGAAITGSKLADNSIDLGSKTSTWDGWIQVSDSWTYLSSTSVTVPSDATTKYSVGDKIKFVQTTTKYFYVTAVTATTLTLSGGTDYTVANAAISGIYYSKVATPQSFPHWFAYSPTWAGSVSNPAIGNGTLNGYFCMNGKNMTVRIYLKMGSTTTYGSGVWKWSVPANSASTANTDYIGKSHILDSGTSYYTGISHIGAGTGLGSNTTVDNIRVMTHGGANDVGATHPITFANNDCLVIYIQYEI